MTDPLAGKDELDRMWQQAELYESQGLRSPALDLYEKILQSDPDNRDARTKVDRLQSSLEANPEADTLRVSDEQLSPREALDLGVAYMGMNQYADALEMFHSALRSSPAVRGDLMRHSAICLIHLQRYDEAHEMVGRIVSDRALSVAEKGAIVSEVADMCSRMDLPNSEYALLMEAPDECKPFIPDYDDRVAELVSQLAERELEVVVSDEETGEAYTTTTIGSSYEGPGRILGHQPVESIRDTSDEISLLMRARAVCSVDGRDWSEGTLSELANTWSVIQIPHGVNVGSTLMVLIHLPSKLVEDPLWVMTKVVSSEAHEDGSSLVTTQFVSFPSGGDNILKSFIRRARQDPSILRQEIDTSSPAAIPDKNVLYQALQEQAVREMEHHVLPPDQSETMVSQNDPTIAPPRRAELEPTGKTPIRAPIGLEEELERAARKAAMVVRFACVCGQVHTVPRSTVGRKGKCVACGREMKVPQVASKADGVSDQIVGRVVGGCRILYKIGGGGMGGVFAGHHLGLDISVAVKILHAHLAEKDSVFVKRFIREARAAAKLQHPNIVSVMNVGYEDGMHFIVMQYLGGGSVAILQSKLGRVPVDKVIDIGIQIALALVVAEENNILHRDIKPANILLTEKGEAKLADLGLAKTFLDSADAGITQTGITCGTPLYFSPEQAKGVPNLDIRSDIYSLGITLYHLLEGAPPFMGESAYVIFQKHVHEELPPFKTKDPPVPEQVFQVIKKMTAKKPKDRFQSAKEVVEVLEDLRDELTRTDDTTERRGLLRRLGIKLTD